MSNLSTLFDRYKALVVFDTETSGLDFDSDQIIELAALRVERTATGGLRIAGKMDTFIKLPEGETLPENIVSLTGITDERLQTEGVQPVKAAGQIAKLMQNGPTLMIAHNAQFDACFLRGLLRGQKVGRIGWLDSLTVYKDRRAYPHKLANAIIAYDLTGKGAEQPSRHRRRAGPVRGAEGDGRRARGSRQLRQPVRLQPQVRRQRPPDRGRQI
ncbi:MAG: PolC-type DNA polymerase III [Dysosmobacter sp.]